MTDFLAAGGGGLCVSRNFGSEFSIGYIGGQFWGLLSTYLHINSLALNRLLLALKVREPPISVKSYAYATRSVYGMIYTVFCCKNWQNCTKGL